MHLPRGLGMWDFCCAKIWNWVWSSWVSQILKASPEEHEVWCCSEFRRQRTILYCSGIWIHFSTRHGHDSLIWPPHQQHGPCSDWFGVLNWGSMINVHRIAKAPTKPCPSPSFGSYEGNLGATRPVRTTISMRKSKVNGWFGILMCLWDSTA